MLSKEEIEKAKRMLSNPKKEDLIEIIRIFKRNGIENYCIAKNESIETLLQYIIQLEQENNKQFKIIDEMAAYIAGLDIDEDICKKVEKSLCNGKTSAPVSSCIECIRQYFEKKVEEK